MGRTGWLAIAVSTDDVEPRTEGGFDLSVQDVRTFVPAADFAVSRDFYLALGWQELWTDGSLSLLELAGHRFMLQDFYVREWAENSMVTVEVSDAAAWYAHVSSVLERHEYGDARVAAPRTEDWGALVTHVWDPCGVLYHFAQVGGR